MIEKNHWEVLSKPPFATRKFSTFFLACTTVGVGWGREWHAATWRNSLAETIVIFIYLFLTRVRKFPECWENKEKTFLSVSIVIGMQLNFCWAGEKGLTGEN